MLNNEVKTYIWEVIPSLFLKFLMRQRFDELMKLILGKAKMYENTFDISILWNANKFKSIEYRGIGNCINGEVWICNDIPCLFGKNMKYELFDGYDW